MSTPPVRPPMSVRGRRVWRLFRTQSPVFQVAAAVSAAVLAVAVVTAANGFSPSTGQVALHQQGPGGHHPGGTGGKHGGRKGRGGKHGGTTGGSGGSTGGGGSGTGAAEGAEAPPARGALAVAGIRWRDRNSWRRSLCGEAPPRDRQRRHCHDRQGRLPYPQLSGINKAVSGALGSSEDPVKSIKASVDWVNKHGGINCRQIAPGDRSVRPDERERHAGEVHPMDEGPEGLRGR